MRPFYLYLMKFRQPKEIDAITKFANHAYKDHGFPKQSTDYNELSSYLELNGRLSRKYVSIRSCVGTICPNRRRTPVLGDQE